MLNTRTLSPQARACWLRNPIQCGGYKAWLIDRGSLTQALVSLAQSQNQSFCVQLMAQRKQKPLLEEAPALHLKAHQYALVREVSLNINGLPVVFAHSILPQKSLRGLWLGLKGLGNRPLGGALFANPKIIRTPLTYKKLSRHHPLYQTLVRKLPAQAKYQQLWARRSIFSLHGASIMVTEVFLPTLIELHTKPSNMQQSKTT